MISIKTGDTLLLQCQYQNDDGTPQSLEGVEIKSQVRTLSGDLQGELIVDIVNVELGKYNLTSDGTGDWVVGKSLMDIQYDISGNIASTDSIILNIVGDVTR